MNRRHRRHSALLVGSLATLLAVSACTSVSGSAAPATTAIATSTTKTSTSTNTTDSSSTSTAPGAGTGSADDPDSDSDSAWIPSETNPDPSVDIADIYVGAPALYGQRYHFAFPDQVAYDRYPPVGGPHDPVWAACDGVVYTQPVRNEMMVHTLEHGAVWIAYNPETLPAAQVNALAGLVARTDYLVMTPYPELDTPLSLQAWAHQLKLDSADDPRLRQFILSLQRNPILTPEVNATCSQPSFNVADPPAFDGSPPGADAVPLDFEPPPTTTS